MVIKKIAVMTSGGDAPGMNAAVRAVVRAALNRGWEVYGIKDAYLGLVEGGEYILPLDWVDVSWNFGEGGTFLGSARYSDLKGDTVKSRELKERALLNLNALGISGLVIIGGDGSLTGGYELFTFLKQNMHMRPEFENMELSIVGVPATIDNDIAGTDTSIGVDTTLSTIVECVDKLRDTAASHRRVIIVEVMGRLRGYLAVMSGLATGADRVFIPEEIISQGELNRMLRVLKESFAHGQKAGIIFRSEGTVFSTTFLKETIAVLLEPRREVRETVLGHLQRGGRPTAFEEEVLPEPQMVGLSDNKIKSIPLVRSLAEMKASAFREELSVNAQNAFQLSRRLEAPPSQKLKRTRIAILTDGNNVSGMNMAIRAIARLAINQGLEVKGIKGGFSGLCEGSESILNLEWGMLEMKSTIDEKDALTIRNRIRDLKIDGIITIGNKKTYQYSNKLSHMIKIPVVSIPAALSCNLPGTDRVIGMDSALNDLVQGIDKAVDAAHVQKKIFIIHVKGEYCHCLVKHASLAGGTEQMIIDRSSPLEEDQDIFQDEVRQRVKEVKRIIDMGKSFATIVFFSSEHEKADGAIQFIKQVINDYGIMLETTIIPLEMSYGGIVTTAFDRVLAKRFGEKALGTLQRKMRTKDYSFHIVGIIGKRIVVNRYQDTEHGFDYTCDSALESELEHCLNLMAQPSDVCIGMGGAVNWIDIEDENRWKGLWKCNKCGQSEIFSFNPAKLLCCHCKNEMCHNYGYVRTSRRL
jgi:6-phosphofructokinase 1